jgi:mitochondrial fission protein ELM1
LTQPSAWVLSEAYAGLQAQALGLAEAAGLTPAMRVLAPRAPWRFLPAARWPAPLRVVRDAIQPPLPDIIVGCGGVAAAVGAALRRPGLAVVQVQNPRLDPRRFDLIVANRHDELTGPNVVVTRTALHRATPERLADAAEEWRDRMADLPRPLVAVLVGGSNGRFRLDAPIAAGLAVQLAEMMRRDGVGVALTPSRRTDPAAVRVLTDMLEPLGGFVWDGEGENPYFGLLALADAIVVTMDSVSMVSEAAATSAPVLVAPLPGKSRRIGLFLDGLTEDGRIRPFAGRLEVWPTAPLDDTPVAAAAMRQRLGF